MVLSLLDGAGMNCTTCGQQRKPGWEPHYANVWIHYTLGTYPIFSTPSVWMLSPHGLITMDLVCFVRCPWQRWCELQLAKVDNCAVKYNARTMVHR